MSKPNRDGYASLANDAAAIVPLYVAAYPHMTNLANNALAGTASSLVAMRDFARTACHMAVPGTVTPGQVWLLSKLTEGWK